MDIDIDTDRQTTTTTTTTTSTTTTTTTILLLLLPPLLPLLLQLHYTNYITIELQLTTTTPLQLQLQLQLQLRYTTLHPAVAVRWPLQPLQPFQKNNSNHLSVHQWIRSAIHESQQPTSPIGSYFWNFRHRLVRYYWYNKNGPLDFNQKVSIESSYVQIFSDMFHLSVVIFWVSPTFWGTQSIHTVRTTR